MTFVGPGWQQAALRVGLEVSAQLANLGAIVGRRVGQGDGLSTATQAPPSEVASIEISGPHRGTATGSVQVAGDQQLRRRFHSTDWFGDGGEEVPASATGIWPDSIELAGKGGGRVWISVRLSGFKAGQTYHSTLYFEGAESATARLRLTVQPAVAVLGPRPKPGSRSTSAPPKVSSAPPSIAVPATGLAATADSAPTAGTAPERRAARRAVSGKKRTPSASRKPKKQ